MDRIVGRRMDPDTGDIYNISFKPPPPEIEHRLIQRKDDTEETVRNRLETYHEQTEPLGSWYGSRGLLIPVDGCGTIAEVGDAVTSAVINL